MKQSYREQYNKNFLKESEYFENSEFKVYGQKTDPKGNVVIRKKLNDRSIWYVPQIQN